MGIWWREILFKEQSKKKIIFNIQNNKNMIIYKNKGKSSKTLKNRYYLESRITINVKKRSVKQWWVTIWKNWKKCLDHLQREIKIKNKESGFIWTDVKKEKLKSTDVFTLQYQNYIG